MRWLLKQLGLLKEPCEHSKNYKSKRWTAGDGTPMAEFQCFDCGWYDHGHVHGDPDGWSDMVVVVRNGIEDYRWERSEPCSHGKPKS